MEVKGEKAPKVQKEALLVPRDQKIVEKTLEMEKVQRVQKEVLRVPRDQKMVEKILEMEEKGEKEEMDQKEAKVLKVQKVLEEMKEVVAMEKEQKVPKVQEEIQGKILEKFLHLVLLAQTLKLLYVLDHALVNLEILLKDSQLMVL